MNYSIWALFLILQNFSFVLVSRARNSKSIKYHMVMSFFSNSIWFFQSIFLLTNQLDVLKTGSFQQALGIGMFYTFFTMTGAMLSHKFAIYLEAKKKIS